MQRRIFLLPLLTVLAIAGCGSSSPNHPAAAGSSPPAASTAAVRTETTPIGDVLADSAGHTMYLLTADKAGKPTCSAACQKIWPPVLLATVPSAPSGVSARFGLVATSGGEQLTVDGYPAYTFAGDSAAGQANGEGIKSFGGAWYALSLTGAPIANSSGGAPSSSSPSSSSSSSGGYSY